MSWMVCVRCLRQGKPMPELGAPATAHADMVAVAVYDGETVCNEHLRLALEGERS